MKGPLDPFDDLPSLGCKCAPHHDALRQGWLAHREGIEANEEVGQRISEAAIEASDNGRTKWPGESSAKGSAELRVACRTESARRVNSRVPSALFILFPALGNAESKSCV